VSQTTHKQFYAGHGPLLDWVKRLTVGDWFVDAKDVRFLVECNDLEHSRIDIMCMDENSNSPHSSWPHESFIKAALDHKFERICRNCKRKRKEHLQKAKCLFGATSWA